MKLHVLYVVAAGVALACTSSFASNLASDNAADAAYADQWQAGDNGGSGFGAWTQGGSTNGANGGYFVASSTNNGDGGVNGDIDTSNQALGIYANGGQSVSATRGFTGGSLSVGQTFSMSFDNGFINTGSSDGFVLESSIGTDRLSFFFTGGNASYELFDNSGFVNTGIGYTDSGLTIAVTLTGADTYSALITSLGGSSTNITGTLQNSGSAIDQVTVNNNNAGGGGAFDFYVNSLQVIPEPSSMALTGLGVLVMGWMRRRRAK